MKTLRLLMYDTFQFFSVFIQFDHTADSAEQAKEDRIAQAAMYALQADIF